MIDRNVFVKHWQSLCKRWNRAVLTDEAVEYRNYLDAVIDTEGFEAASRYLWATREFFPRPVDFVLAAAEVRWIEIRKAASDRKILGSTHSSWRPQDLLAVERDALKIAGGIDNLLNMPFNAAKKEFLRAYEVAAGESAMEYSTLGTGKSRFQLAEVNRAKALRAGEG